MGRVGINARLHPVTVDSVRLRPLAGVYGTVELKMSPEGLRFYRADRPKRPQGVVMTPLDDSGLFEVPGYADLRLRVTGPDLVLMHGAEDAQESFERSR